MDFVSILKSKYNIDLNSQQKEAVDKINGPTLLLSVPGGGKTTVIVSRVANMILNHNIEPNKILTLTFSRASALDMKSRFSNIFGKDIDVNVDFSTIHSFCYTVINHYVKMMNKPFPKVIEGGETSNTKKNILKKIYLDINKEYIGEDTFEDLVSSIGYIKNMLLKQDEIEAFETNIDNFSNIYFAYEKHKREQRLIDYDDMLTGTYQLFKQNKKILNVFRERYPYINIDESQDTSLAQHELIKLLAEPNNNIFMVGDEDQSIYGFRAACPKALLDFKKTYPGSSILLMERNYRSTKDIVASANNFIKQNKERYEKNMFTSKEQGEPIQFIKLKDKQDQYSHIISAVDKLKNYSECAILYRNNTSAIALSDFLDRNNIPFYLRESNIRFFNHWLVLDILAYIKLSLDLSDVESFSLLYYKMNGFLSKNMFEHSKFVIQKHKNVFNGLLTFPGIKRRTKDTIFDLHKNVKKIAKKSPFDAIGFIENKLEYKTFIRQMTNEKGYSPETLNQILDNLKLIAKKTKSFEEFFERLTDLQEVMSNSYMNKYKNAVTLSTIHSSKGLEFDNVMLVDLVDGQFPTGKSISEYYDGESSSMEEEVRLFYVGMTRARHILEIITFDNSNNRLSPVSRFAKQLINSQNINVKNNVLESANFKKVTHSMFGVGQVISVDAKTGTMNVKFKDRGEKTLSIETCIEKGIVTFDDY